MFDSQLARFKIKKFKKEIEPQEILLDSLAQKKEQELGGSEKKLEFPLPQKILRAFWFVFLILIFILFGRAFQLQILEGKTFQSLSERNKFIIRSIQAERGVIYDKNLKQLVFNKSSFNLICDDKIVLEDLSHETLILYKTNPLLLEKDWGPNCQIESEIKREYLKGPVFAHLIGYQQKTGEKTGLEKYYDEILRARLGELQIKRDAHGNLLSKETISMPEPGKSLVLWLDSELQKKLGESLEKSIKRVGARGGAAVALDPQTGGVLALVSYPSFNNNLFSQGISAEEWKVLEQDPQNPLFNRAISGIGYPTGSVIKPLIGLAALEEGIIDGDTKIYSPLRICIQNPWYPEKEDCFADWRYHGTSDIKRAIAESVNTFFYQIGGGYKNIKGLGATKIKEWLEIFGWGSKTGIDLPNEGQGILPNLENNWRLGNTYHFSIGQGPLSITPLQVAFAFVAIANGGKLYQPQLVKEIIDNEKNIIKKNKPVVLREITLNPENLEIIRQGMRQSVTTPGIASHLLYSLPVEAAAKTGTAQTGREKVYHHWVTVFAPYDDPQIVLTIVIEYVKGLRAATLPVAKEVLEWYFGNKRR